MQRGRMQKGEAVGAYGVRSIGRRKRNRDAERLQHIGGAALRGDGAIAVLGDQMRRAGGVFGGGGDQRCGGGDVEGAAGIAASAAGIDQQAALLVVQRHGRCGRSHGVDKAGELARGLAARSDGAEQRGEFQVARTGRRAPAASGRALPRD